MYLRYNRNNNQKRKLRLVLVLFFLASFWLLNVLKTTIDNGYKETGSASTSGFISPGVGTPGLSADLLQEALNQGLPPGADVNRQGLSSRGIAGQWLTAASDFRDPRGVIAWELNWLPSLEPGEKEQAMPAFAPLDETKNDGGEEDYIIEDETEPPIEGNDTPIDRGFFISKHLDEPVPYDKLFPSQAIRERDFIVPGHHLPVVEHNGVKVGAAVCVDFFYPELVRSLALRGASLVINPANIPTNRMPLWHRLGVTRASENTVFTAMANNTGTSYPDQRQITGDSFVAYPDGFQLFTFGTEPGTYYNRFDLSLIDQVRQRWPYLDDIRERGMEVPK